MRHSFRLGVLAMCLLAPSIAAADSGWYLGLGLGESYQSHPTPLYSQTSGFREFNDIVDFSGSSDRESKVTRFEGGYWGSSNFGVQLSYVDLGHYTHDESGHTIFECQTCVVYPFDEHARVNAHGVALAVTGRWPLSDSVELIGRAGAFWSRVVYYEYGNLAPPGLYPIKITSVAPMGGLSLGWNLESHWEMLLGIDEYFGIGGSRFFSSFDATVLSLGVQYHF